MPNRNIYFTDEQVAQMKRFSKENWSAVCQSAVDTRVKYLELRSQTDASAIERAKARLAEAKAAFVATARERGERAGVAWAADKASFEELQRLHAALYSEEPSLVFPLDDGDLTSIWVAAVIAGEALDFDPSDIPSDYVDNVQDFCNDVGLVNFNKGPDPFSPDVDSGDFWEGFITGALTVFEQI